MLASLCVLVRVGGDRVGRDTPQPPQDLKERDEFAERLRQKDLAKTKTLSGKEVSSSRWRIVCKGSPVMSCRFQLALAR